MSLLLDLYNIQDQSASDLAASLYFPLATPMKKLNSLEFDTFEESIKTSILWNFGDPFNVGFNETISNSVLDVVPHTYTYAGNYTVNCVATINGTHRHIKKNINIVPDSGDRVIASKPEGTYTLFVYDNFDFPLSLYCYDDKATIYYTIGATSTDYQKYTGTLHIPDDFVIKYYAVLESGYSTEVFTKTYVLIKNQYQLSMAPIQSVQASAFNFVFTTTPNVIGNPDFKIYYTTTQNLTPTLYTGSFLVSQSTTITGWIVHTYLGDDYIYDPVVKSYIIG